MKDELYINGRFVELSDVEPVGFTYQVNDIAELSDPRASYSNQFLVPGTNSNSLVLNFSNQIPTNTLAPYRLLGATFIRNGSQIIENGVAIIVQSQGDYEIILYSGIFDFFTQIKDFTLKDIDWSELNHVYDLAHIRDINQAYCQGNSNVSWPLINWGGYDSVKEVDIKYQMPAINYPLIIKKIFEKTDYTYDGNIFRESIFNEISLTLSPDVFTASADDLTARSFKSSSFQSVYHVGGLSVLNRTLSNIMGIYNVVNEYDDYDSTAGAFFKDSTNPITVQARSPQSVYDTDIINGHPAFVDGRGGFHPAVPPLNRSSYRSSWFETINIAAHFWYLCPPSEEENFVDPSYVIVKNNVILTKITLDTGTDKTLFDNEFSIDLVPGDEIRVYIEAQEVYTFKTNLGDHSYLNIQAQSSLLLYTTLNYNNLVPDIKLTDIIGSLCKKFALIITPQHGVNELLFTQYRQIKANINNAQDWSKKIDLTVRPLITYRIGNYAKINNLKWLPDDITKGFGDSYFSINDTTLLTNVDLFELIYPSALPFNNIRATSDQPSGGNTGVVIPRFTLASADEWAGYVEYKKDNLVKYGGAIYMALVDNQNFTPNDHTGKWSLIPIQFIQTEKSDSRLVILRKLGNSEMEQVDYTDGININSFNTKEIPLAYFADSEQVHQLTFQYLIANYYKEVINMLNQLKVVTCLINLSELDILQLDFLTLKYIEYFGNHFYLNKVNDYVEGKSTSCDLIRM